VIEPLIGELDNLLGSVGRRKSINVNDRRTKARAVSLATLYFSDFRPVMLQRLGESALVTADAEWQNLVRLAQGNNSRRSYVTTLRIIRNELSETNVALLSSAAPPTQVDPSAEEQVLITTIEGLVPSASASYSQGLLDLRAIDRLSYRGTATEFRETLREVLDHLAPNDAVTRQDGFRLEPGQSHPTMKQKVGFVLKSRGRGKSQRDATEKSVALIEELVAEIARAVYNRASVATHVLETREEVGRIKRFVDTVLFDLLELRAS